MACDGYSYANKFIPVLSFVFITGDASGVLSLLGVGGNIVAESLGEYGKIIWTHHNIEYSTVVMYCTDIVIMTH